MSKLILGLDVSTSVTGVALLEHCIPFESAVHVKTLRPIELANKKGLWNKVDYARDQLKMLRDEFPTVSIIAIEEPLKSFSSGLSSADTIMTLIRFNGIMSLLARDLWGHEPTYVNASHARKLLGVGVKKTSIVGKNAKQQTFEHIMSTELAWKQWPLKKSGKMVDWAPDVVDAYVVARSVML